MKKLDLFDAFWGVAILLILGMAIPWPLLALSAVYVVIECRWPQ